MPVEEASESEASEDRIPQVTPDPLEEQTEEDAEQQSVVPKRSLIEGVEPSPLNVTKKGDESKQAQGKESPPPPRALPFARRTKHTGAVRTTISRGSSNDESAGETDDDEL